MAWRLTEPGREGETPAEFDVNLDAYERRVVRRCLAAMAVMGTASMVGALSVLYLANHYPLLLIALSPIGRHLILVAPTVSPVPFVAVATLRRLVFYFCCFMLGRILGARALASMERRFRGASRFVRWLDTIFRRARYPAVFLLLGPVMSTIAGNARMPVATWIPLVAAGLVVRMIAIVWFGEWMREPIEYVLALFDEYWVPGTLVLVAGTCFYQWRKRRLSVEAANLEGGSI
jgi:membrane protein DedA with SNARE-associated domain